VRAFSKNAAGFQGVAAMTMMRISTVGEHCRWSELGGGTETGRGKDAEHWNLPADAVGNEQSKLRGHTAGRP